MICLLWLFSCTVSCFTSRANNRWDGLEEKGTPGQEGTRGLWEGLCSSSGAFKQQQSSYWVLCTHSDIAGIWDAHSISVQGATLALKHMNLLIQEFSKPDQGHAEKEVSTSPACQPNSAAFKVIISRKRKRVCVLWHTRSLAFLAHLYVHTLDVGGG